MNTLFVTCGISGSGKSTWAANYTAINEHCKVVSTDRIREELWGSEEDQQHPDLVFKVAHERIHELLSLGYDVIFDATNLSRRDRRKLIKEYKENKLAYMNCVDFGNDYKKAIELQKNRHRQVPLKVIKRQVIKYQKPVFDEGWDMITSFAGGAG